MIVAAVVDWLLRPERGKVNKQVTSREGNVKRVLPTGRLSARAPVANEDCGKKNMWSVKSAVHLLIPIGSIPEQV